MDTTYIHPSAVIEDEAIIGQGSRIWHFCHIRKNARIGTDVVLGKDVYIDQGVTIGRGCRIQNGVSVYKGVEIGDWCFIGPHVIFTNDTSPRAGNKNWQVVPTILQAGMSIGAGSIILCGITIGSFAMVGAGAIVTKDVPPFHICTGFPAKTTKMVCCCGQTFLALDSPKETLLRDCCLQNMNKKTLKEAEKVLATI